MKLSPKFLLAGLLLIVAGDGALADYKRGYVDARFGQIHYHKAWPGEQAPSKPAIVFFHQNPKSAVEYEYLLKEMGSDRVALAFDTPGYGESDRPAKPALMGDLALAMADALDNLGYGAAGAGPVDVFGFHTGVYIAAELALLRPDLVRRVVLSGIAFRSPERRAELLDDLPRDVPLAEDGSRMLYRWYLIVIKRAEGVSVARAARSFLEDMHSLDKSWFAYHAVWSYPIEERFGELQHPILILQPHELLLEETRRVHAELLPQARYVEIPQIVDDVFDTGWAEYAHELRSWLDAPAE